MTKKQLRAENRIRNSKEKKAYRFQDFILKVAKRRLKDSEDSSRLRLNFHCIPDSLGMPLDEFLARGQLLCGGAAVLFDRGELAKVLPNWQCDRHKHPTVLIASYLQQCFHEEDGRYRNQYNSPTTSTSGSW